MSNVKDMTCRQLVELVTEYFDGALADHDRARFEAHLAACPHCRAYLQQMRETIALTGALAESQVTPEASGALLAAFRDWKRGA
jgi:anti-sigma factor RsiW